MTSAECVPGRQQAEKRQWLSFRQRLSHNVMKSCHNTRVLYCIVYRRPNSDDCNVRVYCEQDKVKKDMVGFK